ncbi:MAG: Gfo/Idh/MocA family protein [Hyphomicrobiaceae bacterium]
MTIDQQSAPSGSDRADPEMAQVRYALVGSGMMGQEHIRTIGLIPEACVSAIADPDPDMRSTASRLVGGSAKVFASHREMMAVADFDAVLVASPNHTHIDVLRDVMQTDVPILVEKPLCSSVANCREVHRLQTSRSAPVWVGMEYRYMPPVEQLLKLVRAGTAGRLHMIAIREHRYPFLDKVGDWNRHAVNTGGTLVEKCCHFFDLMRLISGSEAARVYASGAIDVNHLDEPHPDGPPDIIDNAFVIVNFANGMRAMLDLCMFGEGSYWQETISATGDAARVTASIPGPARFSADGQERDAEIIIADRATKQETREPVPVDETILESGDHHGSTYYQHLKFVDMVKRGGQPEVGLDDGLRAVMIGAAAEESIKTGQVVPL